MKSFKEFILEANKYGIPEDEYQQWKKDRAEGRGPARKTFDGVEYEMRGKGTINGRKTWGVSTVDSRRASSQKRSQAEKETALTKDELLRATGGDEERVALALDTERSGIKKVRERGKRSSRLSGEKKSLGHKVALQPDEPSPEDPGHVLSNIGMEPLRPNASKGNRRPEPGEPGYGLTRSQAIQDADRRGDELGSKIDRERDLETPSRAARLLSRLRRPRPKSKRTPDERLERDARMYLAAKRNNLPDNG